MNPAPHIFSPWELAALAVGLFLLVAAAIAGILSLIAVLRLRWRVRRFAKAGDL